MTTTTRIVYRLADARAGTNKARSVYVLERVGDDGLLRVFGGIHSHPDQLDEGEWLDARARIFRPEQLEEIMP